MMYHYVCREVPEGKDYRLIHNSIIARQAWDVFMIMKSEEEFIDRWMYKLPNGKHFWLEDATQWEYDMLDAVGVPTLDPDSDFAFARGWSRSTTPPTR